MKLIVYGTNIDLRPVEIEDAEFILSLRLDPELNQYLSPVEDNLEKQREWIKNYRLYSRDYYFIIQNKMQESIGTIRVYDIQDVVFCWGSWIVIPQARKYASFESAFLLYRFAFEGLGLDKTNFDIRKDNKRVLNFHQKFGATIFGETDADYLMTYTKNTFLEKQDEYQNVIKEAVSYFQK